MKCEDCGGPVYDNRQDKRTPNSPDYRCKAKDCGWAKWLTEPGDPSRQARTRKPAGRARPKAVEGNDRETYWADKAESDRAAIPVMRRSHAQEMALRYFQAVGSAPKELNALTVVIDWFEKDATAAAPTPKKLPKPKPAEAPPEDEDELNRQLQESTDDEDLDL